MNNTIRDTINVLNVHNVTGTWSGYSVWYPKRELVPQIKNDPNTKKDKSDSENAPSIFHSCLLYYARL